MAADGTRGLLGRLLRLLWAALPRARFLVWLDGGYATPETFNFLGAEPRLDDLVAMAKNAALQRHVESAMQVARAQREAMARPRTSTPTFVTPPARGATIAGS